MFDHFVFSTDRTRACEKMQITRKGIFHDVVLVYAQKTKMAAIERKVHLSCLNVKPDNVILGKHDLR